MPCLFHLVCVASLSGDDDFLYLNISAGPTLGVAVVAWLLGVAGAVVVLLFRARATTDQEGPFKRLIAGGAGSNGSAYPAPGGQAPPYSGTV